MASITSGKMADYDWLRNTFSGPLFSRTITAVHYVKTNACIFKQNSKCPRLVGYFVTGYLTYDTLIKFLTITKTN